MANLLVMMSTHNGSLYVKQQILSIINQKTKHRISLLIRDDGSTDDTYSIIEQVIENYPNIIRVIKGNNIGSNASFFELLKIANGYDYYAISDQDDVFIPEKYEIACNELDKRDNSTPLLFSSTSFLVGNDLIPYGETRNQKKDFTIYNTLIQNICPGHNQVFNNELLQLLKKTKHPEFVYVYDMWIANIAVLYGEIIFLNKPLTYYRQHESNLMGTKSSNIGKLMMSCNRLLAGDGKKTREQIRYFTDENAEKLKAIGAYTEITSFLGAKSFRQRLIYCFRSKFYRQSWIETVSFKLAVLSGKY